MTGKRRQQTLISMAAAPTQSITRDVIVIYLSQNMYIFIYIHVGVGTGDKIGSLCCTARTYIGFGIRWLAVYFVSHDRTYIPLSTWVLVPDDWLFILCRTTARIYFILRRTSVLVPGDWLFMFYRTHLVGALNSGAVGLRVRERNAELDNVRASLLNIRKRAPIHQHQ